MRSSSVGEDKACLQFSLSRLSQLRQEGTRNLPVCLTVPATTQETEPCLTSYTVCAWVWTGETRVIRLLDLLFQTAEWQVVTLASVVLLSQQGIWRTGGREVRLGMFNNFFFGLQTRLRDTLNCRFLWLLLTCSALLVWTEIDPPVYIPHTFSSSRSNISHFLL